MDWDYNKASEYLTCYNIPRLIGESHENNHDKFFVPVLTHVIYKRLYCKCYIRGCKVYWYTLIQIISLIVSCMYDSCLIIQEYSITHKLWEFLSVMRCYIYLLNVFNTVLSSDIYANILQWRVYKVLQNNSNTICFTVVNISTLYVHYVFVRPYTKFNMKYCLLVNSTQYWLIWKFAYW